MSFLQDEFNATQNAISSGAFDPQGSNFTTFSGFTIPGAFSGTGKSSGGLPTSSTTTLGASAGMAPAATGSPSVAAGVDPVSSMLGAAPNTNYFGRAVVIVLGFIFVGAGLHMFQVVR